MRDWDTTLAELEAARADTAAAFSAAAASA